MSGLCASLDIGRNGGNVGAGQRSREADLGRQPILVQDPTIQAVDHRHEPWQPCDHRQCMFAEVAQADAPSTYELGGHGFAPPHSRLPAAGDVVVHGDRESDECHAVVCSTDGHRLVKMEGAAQQAAIWRHMVAGGVLSRPGRPWPTAKGPTSWVDQQPMRPSPTSV